MSDYRFIIGVFVVSLILYLAYRLFSGMNAEADSPTNQKRTLMNDIINCVIEEKEKDKQRLLAVEAKLAELEGLIKGNK